MHETFEERLAGALDALYQGALFLTAGDARATEDLLVQATSRGFAAYAADGMSGTSFGRCMEECLIRCFAGGLPPEDRAVAAYTGEDFPEPDPAQLRMVPPDALFRAARVVPPLARAALWLVTLRRWPYAEAARSLDVDREGLTALLTHRRGWLAALTAGGGDRSAASRGR